jgi:hypothetical protein
VALIDIDGALIQAYIDIGLGLDTAYENVEFTPPKSTDWAAVFIVPAVTDFNSLGANGTDLHTGFMQIDFSVSHGTGRAALLGYAESIRNEFVGGKGYVLNSQRTRITTVERSSVRTVDGFTRLSMTINWEAETVRPTV